ncbi:MAG TPA: LysR family transcriptional regulator [Telluria sp.]|nr:LysR family transcriptional regulator [Telluria sp.]
MDLHRIDLNLLVSLDRLLAEKNVTHAARRLSLSQPALSAQLRQLRELFGDPLLVPAARGMTPTLRALELQAPLRELLASAHRLVAGQQSFDPATSDATFRIAATDSIQATVCVDLIARLRQCAPSIRVALFPSDTPARLDERLASGELDLVLGTRPSLPPAAKARLLYQETFLCLLRRGHAASARPLDLDSFCRLDHVLVSTAGGGFSGAVDDALAQLGRARRVVASLTSFLVAPAMVAQSDLICTVPARLARAAGDALVVLAPPCEVGSFSVHMGWHPRTDSDPAQKWLRQEVSRAVGPLGPGGNA